MSKPPKIAIPPPPPPPPPQPAAAAAPVERWIRLDRASGSCAVLELTTQGDRVIGRRQVHERNVRPITLNKAIDALEERAG